MADVNSRAGERYASAPIIEYLDQVHAGLDPALRQAFEAPARQDMPAIQVSPMEGRALQLFLRMVRAETVVEIGTLAGFSTIHLARALPPEGHVWTVESAPKHAAVARENLRDAGVEDRVTVVEGDAVCVLPRLERYGPFDAVFIDADKAQYDHYGRWAAQNLRPGGLLLVDNAYFFGNLLADDPGAAAVRRLHQQMADTFDTVCLPTPDGLLMGIRRG